MMTSGGDTVFDIEIPADPLINLKGADGEVISQVNLSTLSYLFGHVIANKDTLDDAGMLAIFSQTLGLPGLTATQLSGLIQGFQQLSAQEDVKKKIARLAEIVESCLGSGDGSTEPSADSTPEPSCEPAPSSVGI